MTVSGLRLGWRGGLASATATNKNGARRRRFQYR